GRCHPRAAGHHARRPDDSRRPPRRASRIGSAGTDAACKHGWCHSGGGDVACRCAAVRLAGLALRLELIVAAMRSATLDLHDECPVARFSYSSSPLRGGVVPDIGRGLAQGTLCICETQRRDQMPSSLLLLIGIAMTLAAALALPVSAAPVGFQTAV